MQDHSTFELQFPLRSRTSRANCCMSNKVSISSCCKDAPMTIDRTELFCYQKPFHLFLFLNKKLLLCSENFGD